MFATIYVAYAILDTQQNFIIIHTYIHTYLHTLGLLFFSEIYVVYFKVEQYRKFHFYFAHVIFEAA